MLYGVIKIFPFVDYYPNTQRPAEPVVVFKSLVKTVNPSGKLTQHGEFNDRFSITRLAGHFAGIIPRVLSGCLVDPQATGVLGHPSLKWL